MTPTRLTYLAAAMASGEDTHSFLQAQLAADLTRLSDGEACFSAYCDAKGNVIALLRVIRQGDDYLLFAAAELMEAVLTTLRKYLLRAQVRFEIIDETVVGRSQGETLEYDIGEGADDVSLLAAWRARELRAGITWLGTSTSQQYLPQMLGLDRLGAVSFRKGCFPGQEVIARVRYLGKLKRLPLIVVAEGNEDLQVGAEIKLIADDGPAGRADVVEVAASGNETVIFLVARNLHDKPIMAIESQGRRLALKEASG